MIKYLIYLSLLVVILLPNTGYPKDQLNRLPQGGSRNYAENYKDMILAICIATAYKDDPQVAKEAGASAGVLSDWTDYDVDKSPNAIKSLVDSYLSRHYHDSLYSEVKGMRFDLLKCLDLYHSKELDAQVKRFVLHPNRTYQQDNL